MGLFSKKSRVWKVVTGDPILSWPVDGEYDSLEVDGLLLDVPTGRQYVDVVGESYRQGTIEKAAGGYDDNGPINRDHIATLLPEPKNPYDRNAVRVMLPVGIVGYLSREDAVAHRPAIDEAARHGQVIAARASITGGFDREGSRASCGVNLYMNDDPQAVLDEVREYYAQAAVESQEPVTASAVESSGPAPAPVDGWYPDPRGRFQHRYWADGTWTHHVATDGVGSVDPV